MLDIVVRMVLRHCGPSIYEGGIDFPLCMGTVPKRVVQKVESTMVVVYQLRRITVLGELCVTALLQFSL